MANTAIPTLFGLLFQTNAAIVIMLKNIKEMKTIRLEAGEDIDILLDDGSHILAQAKAVVKSSTDFSNVLKNLKKAIESLSDNAKNCSSVNELIYIVNTPKPFNTNEDLMFFLNEGVRAYDSLVPKMQTKINNYITTEHPLDTSKLKIIKFPFETDNDDERNKYVYGLISEFLVSSNISDVISNKDLHRIWENDIFKSGTKTDTNITLNKKDIIWPIIVMAVKKEDIENDDWDESLHEEVLHSYEEVINTFSERYEFVTKVLSSFNSFRTGLTFKERNKEFVNSEYHNYSYLVDGLSIDDETKNILVKTILQRILDKRRKIDSIKQSVNL